MQRANRGMQRAARNGAAARVGGCGGGRALPASVSYPSATQNDPGSSQRRPLRQRVIGTVTALTRHYTGIIVATNHSFRLRRPLAKQGCVPPHGARGTEGGCASRRGTVDRLDRSVEARDRRKVHDDLARRVAPWHSARAHSRARAHAHTHARAFGVSASAARDRFILTSGGASTHSPGGAG
jgi:hypothetical protein